MFAFTELYHKQTFAINRIYNVLHDDYFGRTQTGKQIFESQL